jgi:hypothetical protein
METPDINPIETTPNPLKSEHLTEGVPAIIASVGTEDQYTHELDEFKFRGKDVDYYTIKEFRDEKYLGSNHHGYVISDVDRDIKYTERLYNCTSLIAVGRDLETDNEISFLTHQDPASVIGEEFKVDLKKRLQKLKNRSQDGTVDIIIVGGQNIPDRMQEMSYQDSVNTLDKVTRYIFGFAPVVICGPKYPGGQSAYDSVYFDTENRRLYVIRPKDVTVRNDSFVAHELNDVNEKWRGSNL